MTILGRFNTTAEWGVPAGALDLYNRQLHPDEKQKLAKLQQGQTPEEQQRLADAACYLVQCAAQLSDNDPAKAAAQDSQNRGAGYVSEQRDLRSTGQFVYDPIVDAWADTSARAADWIIQEAKSAGRGAANMGSQFVNKMNAVSGQTPPSDANPLVQANDGNNTPSGTAGAVVTPPVYAMTPEGPVPVSPGIAAPGTPILSSGGNNSGGDGQPSVRDSAGDLASAANQPFKDGQAITNAGRAVTKHPEYFGFDSTQDLRQVYRSDAQLNELAANAVQDILQNGIKTTGAGGRYPNGWVTYTLPDGRAASWATSGEFIGFRGLQK
ncbi:hypothetical protein [Burkholderia gladioli]|uniref:hypothetical protein n=1 Tax=Burkholderia gladioli TaxID=28095 RepID=UPI00163FCD98|nr:hypothetical protein [Burkholderia gladioli]